MGQASSPVELSVSITRDRNKPAPFFQVHPRKGGGEDVAYGYKGKSILIHSITDANGMPLVVITTPANGDERQQVLPMLGQIRLATGKRGNPKRRPKVLAADNWSFD